jgi:hypothetical protein
MGRKEKGMFFSPGKEGISASEDLNGLQFP